MLRVTLSSHRGGLLLVFLDGRKQMAGDCRKLAERSVYLKSAHSESTFKQWPGARKMCRGGTRVGGEAERKGTEDLSHEELPRAGWKKRRFRSWRDAGAGVGCSATSWWYPALPGPTPAQLHPYVHLLNFRVPIVSRMGFCLQGRRTGCTWPPNSRSGGS